ncbi:MAG: ATP-binding protein [Myxococcota bacterium]|jgi:PAS domain S-box-containing protein|nr:ATP-binding protein [Myxococcota bacterium]
MDESQHLCSADSEAFELLVASSLAAFASCSVDAVDSTLAAFLAQLGAFFRVDAAHVGLVDRNKGNWSIAYLWCAREQWTALKAGLQDVPLGAFPWLETQLRGGSEAQVDDTLLLPVEAEAERRVSQKLGLRAWLHMPLQGMGAKVHGSLGLDSFSEARPWSGEERRRLRVLAHGVASLLERKQVEDAFLGSERKFAAMFHANPAAITITRVRDQAFLEGNLAAERLLGFSRDEALGLSSVKFGIWANSSDRVEVARLLLSEGRVREREVHFRRKDGRVIPCLYSADMIELDGEACVLATSIDLSERKRAEEAMLQLQEQYRAVQKMESVGRLAGGVAHDFNNILTAISASVWLALADLADDSPLRTSFDEILLAIESASRLTNQLLLIARQQEPERELIPIKRFIHRLRPIFERLLGEDLRLKLQAETALPNALYEERDDAPEYFVRANAGQLEQVLINLLINARDAMSGRAQGGGSGQAPDRQEVRLSVSTLELDPSQEPLAYELEPGAYVLIAVQDHGIGMTEEVLEHIFEPFFSTKAPGHGTGLGLATSYSIIRQAGGLIHVDSRLGFGSTFSVYLPLVQRLEASQSNEALANTQKLRILVVEDESSLANVVARFLGRIGYRVSTFTEPAQALRALEACESFDILFTDIVLPGMNGSELAQVVHARCPNIRVLFCSGHPEPHPTVQAALAEYAASSPSARTSFLSKPYSLPALARKLRELS